MRKCFNINLLKTEYYEYKPCEPLQDAVGGVACLSRSLSLSLSLSRPLSLSLSRFEREFLPMQPLVKDN